MPNTEKPNTFLWVLRSLISAFLIGYIVSIFMAVFVAGIYPAENLAEDLTALIFTLVFALAYYLLWIRRETLSGFLFILWYAALWPADLLIGGDIFEDAPLPGILMFFLGMLLLVYRAGVRRRKE